MEEKETVKIRFSTVILLMIILFLIGGIVYLLIDRDSAINQIAEKEKEIEQIEKQNIQANKENQTSNKTLEENPKTNLLHFDPSKGKIIESNCTYRLSNNSIQDVIVRILHERRSRIYT